MVLYDFVLVLPIEYTNTVISCLILVNSIYNICENDTQNIANDAFLLRNTVAAIEKILNAPTKREKLIIRIHEYL